MELLELFKNNEKKFREHVRACYEKAVTEDRVGSMSDELVLAQTYLNLSDDLSDTQLSEIIEKYKKGDKECLENDNILEIIKEEIKKDQILKEEYEIALKKYGFPKRA